MSLRKTSSRYLLFMLLAIIGAMVGDTPALGGSGMRIVLPPRKVRPKSRVQLIVDTSWVDANGFQPVRVTAVPIGSPLFPADRSLVVEIRPGRWGTTFPVRLEASRDLSIQEATASASTTIYVPQEMYHNTFAVRVYEDGSLLKDVSTKRPVQAAANYYSQGGTPTVGVVDYDVTPLDERRTRRTKSPEQDPVGESLVELAFMIGSTEYSNTQTPYAAWQAYTWYQLSNKCVNFEFFRPSDLPRQLPALTSLDVLLIKSEDLHRLAEEDRESMQLVQRWLRCGGVLVTTGGGEDFANRESVEQLLGLSATEFADEPLPQLEEANLDPRWRLPRDNNYHNLLTDFRSVLERRDPGTAEWASPAPSRPPFAFRRAQFGTLFVTDTDDWQLDRKDWNWLFSSVPNQMWKWPSRQGLSLNSANDGFWDFMIPGVGLPPVTSFQVLISVFALIIGPLNYALLAKRQRLSWLMLTVPIGSVLTIGSLLLFAMFTDGISIRGRVRSLTLIDQPHAHAVSMSRQAYYAGLAPSTGLQFSAQTLVLPIEPVPVFNNASPFARKRRVVEQRGDTIAYKVGYLPSRTIVQYAVTRSDETELGIEMDEAQRSLTNRLGSRCGVLLYRKKDGEIALAKDVADGATAELTPISGDDATDLLIDIFGRNPLETPLGIDRQVMERGLLGENWDTWGNRRERHGNRNGHMERVFASFRDGQLYGLTPGCYLAIVDNCSEVELGSENCRLLRQFHVVMGQL